MKRFIVIRDIFPMLAQKARKQIIEDALEDDNYIAEKKWDGHRFIADCQKSITRFTSRRTCEDKSDPVHFGHQVDKSANIPHLSVPYPKLTGSILDGEITTREENGKSNFVTRIMGCDPEKAIERQKMFGWVTYRIWDILSYGTKSLENGMPLIERKRLLEDIYTRIPRPAFAHIEMTRYVEGTKAKKALLKSVAEQGLEGIILKHKQSLYIQDDRHYRNWMKVKKVQDFDVVIMGYEEPSELSKKVSGEISITKFKAKGWIGSIVYGAYEKGALKRVGTYTGFSDTLRKEISENKKKYLGKVVELKGQEFREEGIINPRFIRFRDDKNATDCLYSDLKDPEREYRYE